MHLPGLTPSHLIFLTRHGSHATSILSRFRRLFASIAPSIGTEVVISRCHFTELKNTNGRSNLINLIWWIAEGGRQLQSQVPETDSRWPMVLSLGRNRHKAQPFPPQYSEIIQSACVPVGMRPRVVGYCFKGSILYCIITSLLAHILPLCCTRDRTYPMGPILYE